MKKFLDSSIAVKVMIGLTLLSILLMFVTPAIIFSFDSKVEGDKVIMGWAAVFGGQFKAYLSNGSIKAAGNGTFSWQLYITLIVLFTNAVCAYIIGPKGRGYYIFAAVIFFACSVVFFTTKIWLNSTFAIQSSDIIKNKEHLGVGPWCAGFLSIFAGIACIVEFVMRKPATRTLAK